MEAGKQALLEQAYDRVIQVCITNVQAPPEWIEQCVNKGIMGYGTAMDEKVLSIDDFRKVIDAQREQAQGFSVSTTVTPVFRRPLQDENNAFFVDEVHMTMRTDDAVHQLFVRMSLIFGFEGDGWQLLHFHASSPDAGSSVEDTWHVDQWKARAAELQRLVDEKTATLEVKNRELEIEVALERVRSRAMAMQHSDELNTLIGAVFTELTELDLILTRCTIIIYDPATNDCRWWMLNSEDPLHPMNFLLPYHEHPPYLAFLQAWKKRQHTWVYELEGVVKKEWDDHLFSKTELSHLPQVVISGMRAPSRVLLSGSFNNFGGMNVASLEPLSDEHFSILLRFAKVFDLTYTRFNDLQKAEAQAREAQIELALERVRGRAMAMHKSAELLDAGKILYNELLKLGIVSMTCGYVLMDEEEKIGWIYAASPADGTILPKPTGLPHTSAVMGSIKESWKKQEPFHIVELDPQATIEHHTYLATHSIDFLFTLEEFLAMSPEKVVMHSFNFKQGYLLVVSSTRLSAGQTDMVVRFTKVFEMTYRRFLDLQKAEGQAKEARIETALERVRAKAMAMHNSEDLAETIETFYHQVRSLGITPIRCGVGVITKEDRTCELTSMYTKEDGESVVILGNLLLSGHPLLDGIYDNWILQKEYRPVLRGNEIRDYYQLVSGQVSYPDLRQSAVQHGYFFYFPEGGVYAWTGTELHEEEIQIYRRFTSVLSLTYKRYNDLRLAEAQAREAQIQLSLERVRAKTMAMQRSEELAETAELLFEEFRKLSMVTVDQRGTDDRTTIGIFNEARGTYDLWITGLDGERLDHTYPVSLQEPVNIAKAYSAWKAGKPSLVVDMHGAELNQWLDYMKTVGVPVKSNLYNKRRVNSWAFFSKGNLGITTNEPLPEESLQLLQRFADTFNLIYTRFQDLKDAEIRALEAVKEASLDRVRAEIASMRTADDLQRITPLVWRELTTLGVPFLRCGVFIVDDEKQNIHFYLSAPDGKALAVLQLGFDAPGITQSVTVYWREQKVYLGHWSKEEFLQFAHDLESQGQIQSMNTYQGGAEAPESLTLQFVPFAQGMMYVGSAEDLSAPQVALVQSLAEAFSTAYARYEDFNKLEAAKQQIESTLKDLRATQTQLIQSEKMASLGELTAGIAHEIQNPLNFVNNFSEVSAELVDELNEALQKGITAGTEQLAADLKDNLTKINHHGKRAADIVRGMLLHSRNSSGLKEPTDLNVLCDEYLRLAFHGYRAKDKSFNAGCETHFDPSLPQVNLIQQDMGRVVLNLINNAFYAVNERAKHAEAGYAPKVTVSTKNSAGTVEIIVTDNGPGIPESAVNKIFQPFFTTKPTGQGTGLGLSLSYDIVKAHGGQLLVETVAGDHTSFTIQLPQ